MKSGLMKTFPIQRVIEHNAMMKSFLFEIDFSVAPGEFVMLWLPGIDEKPFSASGMADGAIEITVAAIGPLTEQLMKCRENDYLGVRGPFGRGFSLRQKTLLVGGGIGIAPLRYLARSLHGEGYQFSALFGAASAQDIIFLSEYENTTWCRLVTEDGSAGSKGLVTDTLETAILSDKPELIAACGPQGMLDQVKRIAEANSVEYELAFERYMKCGIGICGTCCIEGTGIRVCVEGPVLGCSDLP